MSIIYKQATEKEIELRQKILNIFALDAKYKNIKERQNYLPNGLWESRYHLEDRNVALTELLENHGIYNGRERTLAYKNIVITGKGSANIGMASIFIFNENTHEKILETGAGYFGDYTTNQTLATASLSNFDISIRKIESIIDELENAFENLKFDVEEAIKKENDYKSQMKKSLFSLFK